jgi:hypothetical protein
VTTPINYSSWSAATRTEIHTVLGPFNRSRESPAKRSASDREYMVSSEGLLHGRLSAWSLPSTVLLSLFLSCRFETGRVAGDSRTTHCMWACRHVALSMATRNIHTRDVTKICILSCT